MVPSLLLPWGPLSISQGLRSNSRNDNGTGYYDINYSFLKTLPGKELRFECQSVKAGRKLT